MNTIYKKYNLLIDYIASLGSVAVAFSGGVDSTFLLKAAYDALGDSVIAVTASSCTFPVRELKEATKFCQDNNIKHIVCRSEELILMGFAKPKNRCYLCKRELFNKIWNIARENGMNAVIEGSNLDDDGDYRPGLIAVRELGVKSPLREIQFTKDEIRQMSKELGLSTWNKQSFACLSSRFVYGETITEEKLGMVDQAEQLLLDLGFHQVRVRIHGMIARIELLPSEFEKLIQEDVRQLVYSKLKALGFTYVTLDLGGYQTGSMNATLK